MREMLSYISCFVLGVGVCSIFLAILSKLSGYYTFGIYTLAFFVILRVLMWVEKK